MKRMNFTINKDVEEKLRELKAMTHLTFSDLIRRAIEIYYEEKKTKK
jgi:predicted CopG family antitoxin